jgi:phage/plasmid-like protein (TIGR03299 family)
MSSDVNVQFREEKQGQIAQARAIVERNRADIANYDSGATQAAIDQRLAGQVADGKIEMVGTDRYRVLEGWDRDELFSVQRATRPGEIPLILPETGLDFVNGEAQLYLDAPAWHELGNVRLGGISDVDEVLKLSGLDWEVEQTPSRYYHKGRLLTAPGKFINKRKDTGDFLGSVGKIYTPVQNIEAMRFLQELVSDGDVLIQSAGPLRGGRKVFVSVRLPEDVTIDAGGIDETIVPTIAILNSHDGTTPVQAVATPWNPVCGNTERFALRDAYTRWATPHTTNALKQLAEARRTLTLSSKYYERFEAEETQLARTSLLLNEFDELVADLWPVEDNDRARSNSERRHEALRAGYAKWQNSIGKTALAGERTITEWLDYAAPRRAIGGSMTAAKATAALEGSDDDLKSRAHRRLLTLAS